MPWYYIINYDNLLVTHIITTTTSYIYNPSHLLTTVHTTYIEHVFNILNTFPIITSHTKILQ